MGQREKNISVAGRMVYIRHATEWDLDTIRHEGSFRAKELAGVEPEQIVVAAEEDSIVGFGIVGRPAANGSLCVTVFERKSHRNIGSSIVRHVLETEPQIKALRESFDLPEHGVKMVLTRKRRISEEAGGWSCSVFGMQ